TTTADTTGTQTDEDEIDFRDFVFEPSVQADTTFTAKYLDEAKFDLEGNRTDDGRYIPKEYRLQFTTDIVYASGNCSTYYGTYGLAHIQFSDMLGNHQIAFGSNLNFDLRSKIG